jgi:two-component system OmpR family sensor kinase
VHKQIDLGVVAGDTEPPAGEAGFVRGQEEGLHILLRNLLDNAVKYTPASGQVDVALGLQDGKVTLSVEDSGPGIDLNDRDRVFDRFFRGSDAQAEGGSGLGLAIVKVIADRHGADLALGESVRLGGLKVEVRFPPA